MFYDTHVVHKVVAEFEEGEKSSSVWCYKGIGIALKAFIGL